LRLGDLALTALAEELLNRRQPTSLLVLPCLFARVPASQVTLLRRLGRQAAPRPVSPNGGAEARAINLAPRSYLVNATQHRGGPGFPRIRWTFSPTLAEQGHLMLL